MRLRQCRIIGFLLLFVCAARQPAKGEVFNDIATGLAYLGFDIIGDHNPLSGGVDMLVTNTFVGDELDFGPGDLTLSGPLSMSLSTGGRALSELEFSFRTASNATSTATPLSYILNYDAGGQNAQISGNVLMDANLKLNSFGFYDLEVRYSSRQTVDREGRFADDSQNYDFDLGPVNIRGNIVADLLAAITEPFFQATGQTNIFASFSGSTPDFLATKSRLSESYATLDGQPTDEELVRLANQLILGQVFSDIAYPISPGTVSSPSLTTSTGRLIPEPGVFLLMLLGLPLILRRGLRR